jgi:hypothetical protein
MLSDVNRVAFAARFRYCLEVIGNDRNSTNNNGLDPMFNTVLSLSAALVVIVGLPGLIESTESQLVKMEATRSEIIRAALR